MSLRTDKLEDLQEILSDMEYPYFTWNNQEYYFIASTTDFNRSLDTGGFNIVKLMTATVPMYDYYNGEVISLFPNGIPTSQKDIITYSIDGLSYRIESIKLDPLNTSFRLVAHSTIKLK